MAGRRPGPTETRSQILAAARSMFAEKGYDQASIRGIARSAGVDPALVHHFYGGKEELFVEAMEFPLDPAQVVPRILAGPRERVGERLARTFFGLWDDPVTQPRMLAMVRTGMTSERGGAILREFVGAALLGRVSDALGTPRIQVTAAMGQLFGLAMIRYVLRVEPLASASIDEIVDLVAPTLQRYLAP